MFRGFFKATITRKRDVALAAAGALVGVWNMIDTYRDYKADQEEQENEK